MYQLLSPLAHIGNTPENIDVKKSTQPVTHRIYTTALAILKAHPEGVRWKDLLIQIQKSDPTLHPKTINGCVWKLTERFPDTVHKPSKGLFKLIKQSR